MRPWSGLGSLIVVAIEQRQLRKRLADPGPLGDFYRAGGNRLLYAQLPLNEDDWVVDAGGYHGEWTAGILARYGCRSVLFEPVPAFMRDCQDLFAGNRRVRLHTAALGASDGTTHFSLAGTGTSAFSGGVDGGSFEAQVIGVSSYLAQMKQRGELPDQPGAIGCLKLNIEGGEYEVLEQLLSDDIIDRFRCVLIQFHRQPEGYTTRYQHIIDELQSTHTRRWDYPMVWERWDLKSFAT